MTLPLDVMTAIIGHFGRFGNLGFGKVKHLEAGKAGQVRYWKSGTGPLLGPISAYRPTGRLRKIARNQGVAPE
jgi:hypothetical protein